MISKINTKGTDFTKYVPEGMLTGEQVKELRKSERGYVPDNSINSISDNSKMHAEPTLCVHF